MIDFKDAGINAALFICFVALVPIVTTAVGSFTVGGASVVYYLISPEAFHVTDIRFCAAIGGTGGFVVGIILLVKEFIEEIF